MLWELFRLNTRLLRNHALYSWRSAVRIAVQGLLVVASIALLFAGAVRLSQFDDALVWRVAAVAGSAVALAVFLVPVVAARPELLDRRALRGYGIRPLALAAALLPVGLAGPLLLALVALSVLPAVVWAGRPFTSGQAVLVAVLLGLQLLLGWRLGRALGGALHEHRRLRIALRLAALVLALAVVAAVGLVLLPRIAPLLGPELGRIALDIVAWSGSSELIRIDESLASSPLGALWVALAPAPLGAEPLFGKGVAIGLVAVVLLAVCWLIVVGADLRATRPIVPVREREAPTAFRGVSSSPLGAVAARSTVYWTRDPRYRSVLLFLPIIPAVVFLACWIGGIPLGTAVLVPLPLILLLVGWATLHNDIAYDSTAMWSLLAVQLDGRADRLGRAAPVLALGALLLAVGTPLTVWLRGELAATPVVLGVSLALLLGAVGVSSAVSVRMPYPAARPGDGAFQQPVVSGGSGLGVQALSLAIIMLVASPAIAAALLWLLEVPGPWNWLSLALGAGLGAIALVLGIRLGGRDFDQAAPELLAYTMRN